jgi:hypothetical protein
MRVVPPLVVFVVCLVAAWAIEHRATGRSER